MRLTRAGIVSRRTVLACRLVALVSAVATLSGCVKFLPFDGPIPEPLAIGIDGQDQLVVAVCADLDGIELSADHREEPDMIWREFWDIKGVYALSNGDRIYSGLELVPGSTVPPSPQIGSKDQIVLALITRGRSDNNLITSFRVPASGLKPGDWLQVDGSVAQFRVQSDADRHFQMLFPNGMILSGIGHFRGQGNGDDVSAAAQIPYVVATLVLLLVGLSLCVAARLTRARIPRE